MPRWFIALCLGGSAFAAFACNDDLTEEVDKTVCYSGMRWVGDKRGSPEMFPGRDCVGCHIDNDGPQLAVGGTIYSYVLGANQPGLLAQTGKDCFGLENVHLQIEDAEGQLFDLYTNRAGNFYIEGNPDDFAKPFTARILWPDPDTGEQKTSGMGTAPLYGGCARCHDPAVPPAAMFNPTPPDAEYRNGQPRIGLPGNGPGNGEFRTIENELNYEGCRINPELAPCERLFETYGDPRTMTAPQ